MMNLSTHPPSRTSSFELLKPVCAHASKVAFAFDKRESDGSELVAAFTALLRVLKEIKYLDHRLANYVFRPLSRVFGGQLNYPQHSTNLALCCLNILIARGWNETASSGLCRELIMLLIFILDYSQKEKSKPLNLSNEVVLSAMECMGSLFSSLRRPMLDFCEETDSSSFAIIGKAVSSILAVLKTGSCPKVQLASVDTIYSVGNCLHKTSLFVRFLPGILSALTRVVSLEAEPRRPYRVIVTTLTSIRKLFELLFFQSTGLTSDKEEMSQWARTNASHLKTTLSCIIRVRTHGRLEVREALFSLCLSTLKNFQEPLHDCIEMILETLVELSAEHLPPSNKNRYKESLAVLSSSSGLVEKLSKMLYNWSFQLPKVIQNFDAQKYEAHLGKLLTGYKFCEELQHNSPSFRGTLLEHLLQSIYSQLPGARSSIVVIGYGQDHIPRLLLAESSTGDDTSFTSLTTSRSKPLASIQDFVIKIFPRGRLHEFMYEIASGTSVATNEELLPRLWIIACLHRAYTENQESGSMVVSALDGIYSKCVDVIASGGHESHDWRLEALALEVIAMYATWQSQNFNAELVEVLYPIVERLGAAQPELRNAAIVCLREISRACGAGSPRALIMQNADYLVNAIALRLNAFDLSYQSPHVLVMTIELCGPGIVPYLDDILDSIVGALASYHGYPVLVQSLIGILESMVRQSALGTQYLVGDTNDQQSSEFNLQKNRQSLTATHDKSLFVRNENTNANIRPIDHVRDNSSIQGHVELNIEEDITATSSDKLGKVEEMGFAVARLTQHYVTHKSPNIRLRLLELLVLCCDLLSSNEEKFLPLVNDLWPTSVKRLYDEDSNVKIAAIQAVTRLIECTGSFLSSRIQNEWERIRGLTRIARKNFEHQSTGNASRGKFAEASRVWDAMLGLFVSITQQLDITAEMEDDMFELLAFDASRSSKLKDALESLNSDVFWLNNLNPTDLGSDGLDLTMPMLNGVEFTPLFFT